MASKEQELIESLMSDVTGDKEYESHEITKTIQNILTQYNLSTDMSFIEKIASMKFGEKGEKFSSGDLPNELQNAAFLPVNTIADIALRQDLDMIISQIPEMYKVIQVLRDSTCEADVVTGKLARTISFDKTIQDDSERENTISIIEDVEDRLGLDSTIKNHVVYNAWLYGEAYLYVVPYAKVFSDLYTYRLSGSKKKKNNTSSMFETSSTLDGYGYNESVAHERSLKDTIITESFDGNTNINNTKKSKNSPKPNVRNSIFTEQEIIEIYPTYTGSSKQTTETKNDNSGSLNSDIDGMIDDISNNIHYIKDPVSIPVFEHSVHDLREVYGHKYKKNTEYVQEVTTFFEQVMNDATDAALDNQFSRIKGVYIKPLPATKLIPIIIDKTVIGYYYISDLTRPNQSGERKNSGLGGQTLRSPSVGRDTFSPDQMFCDKLASKIINNFDLKFMRDNLTLHKQIVSVLMAHKFNESMLRFVFIPAENVVRFILNKDGDGKGHSVLEPALATARMYMFLKLYSLLYQINNSQIRVINVRMSGLDKDYKAFIEEHMRKFAARRITTSDIYNFRQSMPKVSGGSELMLPVGPNDRPPITIDTIPASEAPINTELMTSIKDEVLDSTPVPTMMIKTHAVEVDFAKEVENANTMLNSAVASGKIDLNPGLTTLYKIILKWETGIDENIINDLRYTLRMSTAKQLSVTSEMLGNFQAFNELVTQTFLTGEENKDSGEGGPSDLAREYRKLLISEFMPNVDIGRLEELANEARSKVNKTKLESTNEQENIIDDLPPDDEGMI